MKYRNLILAAAVAALPLAAQAATLVIPAVGTGPGANNSQWQSEVTLHNGSTRRAVTVSMTLHQGLATAGPAEVTLQPRETVSISDVVKTKFNVASGSGALVIESEDRDARVLAVNSRTFNVSATGEFGQDIPSIDVSDAAAAGEGWVLTGPSSVGGPRFNFGAYAVEASRVEWQLLRSNGTVTAARELTYAAGEHVQYNSGVETMLSSTPAANDTVFARVISGRVLFYGSIVNVTGDPTFVPAIATSDDILIHFTGVDLDEDGTADLFDADGDGVLDAPVVVVSSLFPSEFALIAKGEFGEGVEFEVISSPGETALLDADTVRVAANAESKGTSGELRVRATSQGSSSILTIPLVFR